MTLYNWLDGLIDEEAFRVWKTRHICTEPDQKRRQLVFKIHPTNGIGRAVTVACLSCNAKCDITDYASW